MKIGYARVSTEDQNLDLQLDALEKAGCEKFFREKITGKNNDRPEFQRMLDTVRRGDVVVVWKIDRLGRNTLLILETINKIHESGALFQSLTETWADSTTPMGKLFVTIAAGFAQYERDQIIQRTKAGLEQARRRRGRLGPPIKINQEIGDFICEQREQGKSVREISKIIKLNETTIWRFLKRQREKE
jgi:DNA invertase Pin-like site-specific DNA recombinase